jgi:hypothetical protein
MKSKTKKEVKNKAKLNKFYENFRNGIREVKLFLDGKVELKDAETWLNELQS